MSSRRIFTDLHKAKENDIFFVHILNQNFAYQIDQIKTVLPDEVEELQIVDGQDYITLLTCTPFGVNDHRLLVRGHRIDYDFSKNPEITTPNVLW
ncbi:MAG: sortase [Erysipelotrichaceae bacterium]|nr:sortase [Erysipelotrichaceae bacterium]